MMSDSVLVISPRFPEPRKSGTQLRVYHSLKSLAEQFDVTLVSLVQDEAAYEYVADIEDLGVTVHTISHSRFKPTAVAKALLTGKTYREAKFANESFEGTVSSLLQKQPYSFIWVHFLDTVTSIPSADSTPVVLDQHNSEIRYWESFQTGSLPERLFARYNLNRIRDLQQRVADRLDVVLSVSQEDAERTRDWVQCPVTVAPNGVDVERFHSTRSSAECDDRIVFVGSLNVRMNEDALRWFVESIWPTVYEQVPGAVFDIVGRNPSNQVSKLADDPGVNLVGEVEDVVPYYERSALSVAPFQFGGGSKLKVLEALSMERPVVTTPIGATGLDVTDGQHLLVRDRDLTFAEGVIELLSEPTRRESLGERGRELVREHYAWSVIMRKAITKVASTLSTINHP